MKNTNKFFRIIILFALFTIPTIGLTLSSCGGVGPEIGQPQGPEIGQPEDQIPQQNPMTQAEFKAYLESLTPQLFAKSVAATDIVQRYLDGVLAGVVGSPTGIQFNRISKSTDIINKQEKFRDYLSIKNDYEQISWDGEVSLSTFSLAGHDGTESTKYAMFMSALQAVVRAQEWNKHSDKASPEAQAAYAQRLETAITAAEEYGITIPRDNPAEAITMLQQQAYVGMPNGWTQEEKETVLSLNTDISRLNGLVDIYMEMGYSMIVQRGAGLQQQNQRLQARW